jgi:cytochrome P450
MTTTAAEPVNWDPYSHAQQITPYEIWRRLRDEAPVYHNEKYGFWALSRFQDVLDASLDTDTFSSAYGITIDMIPDPPPIPMMIMMDPPQHDVLRKVVSRAYTPKRVNALEGRIRELCAEYLDPFVGTGGMDYVCDFGMRLPVMVISTLLGFPEEDHDQLREWSDETLHREEGTERPTPEAMEYLLKQHEYYQQILDRRRADPQDDMISALAEAEFEDVDGTRRKLTDLEILGMIGLISNAGNETVARLLGWTALTLAEFPDQRAQIVADPSLIPGAVEELLRFQAPSPIQGRYTTRPVELHGTTIPQHSTIALLTGSAGRDERQWGSDADRYDARRKVDRHLSLGYGAHFCLGAALARLEGRVALAETLARIPEWDVELDRVTYVSTNTVRGPASAPITF